MPNERVSFSINFVPHMAARVKYDIVVWAAPLYSSSPASNLRASR
jgi:hypothetical protein